jgi:hypothetical protein
MTRLSALALILALAAVGSASAATAQSNAGSRAKAADRYNGGLLYDVVPQGALNGYGNEPAATGGGSSGYNQMTIYSW